MQNRSQWKIILIDDEEDIREVMTIALQDAGYIVDSAADGATGLQLCEDTSPQIVITDIRMPGIDGLQVLETIKKKYPDIKIAGNSSYYFKDLRNPVAVDWLSWDCINTADWS